MQAGTLLVYFLDQKRNFTPNRFVLNMVKDYHLQNRYHFLFFHNFECFNMKTLIACYPVMLEEVNELLVNVSLNHLLMVLGFTGGIELILYLKQFSC